jgi:WD repeat-containing protein 55
MEALELPSEVFDIALHPTRPILATALLSGHVSRYNCSYFVLIQHSYSYQRGAEPTKAWHTKRHKGSCRGVEFSPSGQVLVSVGKEGGIKVADSLNGQVYRKDMEAHT